jgi:cytochrome c553
MQSAGVIISFGLVCAVAADLVAAPQQAPASPDWAYGFSTPATSAAASTSRPASTNTPTRTRTVPPPDTVKRTLAGSTLSFTVAEIRDANGPADWFPGDHPTMPPIVAQGRAEAKISACSLCHYPNGKGRPENSAVAGLPFSYIMQTLQDFRNDARRSADPRKANTNNMIAYAKAMTADEMNAAAAYFSSMKWTRWIKVVETDTVPKTRIATGMFIPLEGASAGKEPIGARIIEVPEQPEETETLRNPRSGFIAYVPRGSVKRGAAIAARAQCVLCHGMNLDGLGPVPGIGGRSPSYIVRQLFDMQRGVRTGLWTDLMRGVVRPLSTDEMRDVAAYVASRTP